MLTATKQAEPQDRPIVSKIDRMPEPTALGISRKQRSTPMISRAIALAAMLVAMLPASALAQKLPPMEISSNFPYESRFVEVLGSRMHYVEKGEGDPILFLHGQPTSSYLWRNIMPHVEDQGRVIAPDNIGFGKSDQPDLKYVFADHYRYIEGFIEAMDLKKITLVVHDWGSGLGLHYARQHPDNIKAIVMMESILAPIMPAESYDALPGQLRDFFLTLRDPVKGPQLMIEENYFVEGVLPNFINRDLDSLAHDVYRQPFLEKSSRKQINQWPNEMPIGGEPPDVAEAVAAYNAWLLETETPLLFLYASPGALNPPEVVDWWAERAKNMETVYIGQGFHFVQEDHPYAIGRAIADWYRRLE
jgi:haloalkane dehalogenase